MIIEKTFKFEVKDKDEPEEMTWYSAMALNGGWRLPTIEELRLMHDIKDKLNMTNDFYWSSTEKEGYYAWRLNFYIGNGYWYNKYNNNRVRLVRDVEGI